MIRKSSFVSSALALLFMGATSLAAPPAEAQSNCTGLSGQGLGNCQLIATLNPAANWPSGTHVNVFAGTADRAAGAVATATATHGGAFAAAFAQQLGIYMLRPPQAPQQGLENAQFAWMWNQAANNAETLSNPAQNPPRPGWTVIGNTSSAAQSAQALANAGYAVFAANAAPFNSAACQQSFYSYLAAAKTNDPSIVLTFPPDQTQFCPGWNGQAGTGIVGVVAPNAGYQVGSTGPWVALAAASNSNGTAAATAFGASFTASQVYYFVFGGVGQAYQSAYAGIFNDGSSSSVTGSSIAYGVQRLPRGELLTGIFTYDSNGNPVWYYSEGTLSATATTPSSALLPATVTSAISGDMSAQPWLATSIGLSTGNAASYYPYVWKPFFQPTTGGANYWDPDGGPTPYLNVGQGLTRFALLDNSRMAATVQLTDPGTVPGSTGAITVGGTVSLNVDSQALTRIALRNATVAVPASNAPATGWWWPVYDQAAWNSTGDGFTPLGLFIDVQGTTMSAYVVGAKPVANAPNGAPQAPYWLLFAGTVNANSVDGFFMQCTKTGTAPTCQSTGGVGSLTQTAAGNLQLSVGNSLITFSRYSTLPATPPNQALPLLFEPSLGSSAAPWGYMAQFTIGTSQPMIATFDFGSSGLYISKDALPTDGSITYYPSVTISQLYDSGVLYNAILASGNFTIGGVTAPTVYFAAVTGCPNSLSECGRAFVGRSGTLGILQKGPTKAENQSTGGVVASPLYQLPAPYGGYYTISLANLQATLGQPGANAAPYTTAQMTTGTPLVCPYGGGPNGCPPTWNNGSVQATISFPAVPTIPGQTASALFDSGASSLRAGVQTEFLSHLSPYLNPQNPTRFASGMQVMVNMPPFFSNKVFTAGSTNWINVASAVPLGTGPDQYTSHNLGSVVMQSYDILWNGVSGLLGARPTVGGAAGP